ncbi:MAG: S8 family serine peptidase [Bacteroidetes bacterium]|nr:S8 family serine peptidase [Bacteroidota bacterium]
MFRNLKIFISCIVLALLANQAVFAQLPAFQPDPPKNWFAMDLKTDGYYGISLDQAYKFLQGKKSKPVVVATIDSGCDTLQQDLQSVLWVNPKKDKDFPGDVHGWDFLGGPGRKCDFNETEEEVRQYFKLKDKYSGLTEATAPNKKEYAFWLQVKAQYDSTTTKAHTELQQLTPIMNALVETSGYIRHMLNLKDDQTFTRADVEHIEPKNDTVAQIKELWLIAFSEDVSTATNVKALKGMSEYLDKLNNEVNPDLDARKRIVGDDPDILHDKPYGNGILKFEDAAHGTQVAGLIGAVRGNNYGIDGVADNVRIMPIKAVPNGDEYDKDVANAIHFAVDHGARIINMSFGKKISPHKAWVDEAFKYAAAHDVLLVQAAGNESQDMDAKPEFPNDQFLDGTKDADNVIDVGASGMKPDTSLAADFSNYGKNDVDIFAPGVKITSTGMDVETSTDDGTSFSSPIVTGIAALIREYFPSLSAKQVKQAILQSAEPIDTVKVYKPGTKELVTFSALCKTGGIVNAYRALENAAKMAGEGK